MSDQGTQYAAFIEAQLKAENDLRSSIDSRAASALTASTGIVTLVLAVFAVLIKKDFTLTGSAKIFLAGALMALLAAAICALLALQPGKFRYTLGSSMADFLSEVGGRRSRRSEPDCLLQPCGPRITTRCFGPESSVASCCWHLSNNGGGAAGVVHTRSSRSLAVLGDPCAS